MKKINYLLLLFIMVFPMMVFAEGNEVVIDFSKLYEDQSNMTMVQDEAFDFLFYSNYLHSEEIISEMDNTTGEWIHYKSAIMNSDNKALYYYEFQDGEYHFYMAEGVTSDDDFQIPLLNAQINSNGSSYSFLRFHELPSVTEESQDSESESIDVDGDPDPNSPIDPGDPSVPSFSDMFPMLVNYDMIRVVNGQPIPTPEAPSSYEVNYYDKGEDILPNLTYADLNIIDDLASIGAFAIEDHYDDGYRLVKDSSGKELFKIIVSDYMAVKIEMLTDDDSFSYQITDEDLEVLAGLYGAQYEYPYREVLFRFQQPKVAIDANNPNTYNNFIYILLVLGSFLLIGKKYIIKFSK